MRIRSVRCQRRAARRLTIVLGCLAVAVTTARACLWDYDTLRAEANGLPGVVEIITGRFDRFPPLYYEMRLERVSREVVERPDNLDLYDNAGVALDRLGRSTEAIDWMARKLDAIERLQSAGEDVSEHRYRYLANLGTFHTHRWLKNGADRSDVADLEQARDLIAAAIELNPDAHFGRERYQLLAIEWLLDPPAREAYDPVPTLFAAVEGLERHVSRGLPFGEDVAESFGDPVEGLSGLIALGAAWESVDIYHSLARVLYGQEHASLSMLAMLRVNELLDSGRASLHPEADSDDPSHEGPGFLPVGTALYDHRQVEIIEFYKQAREEADLWHVARDAYVLGRLERGEHPDTHPEFWGQWVEVSSPPQPPGRLDTTTAGYVIGGVLVVGALIVLVIANNLRRRKRKLASVG